MCLIAFALDVRPGMPLLLAANRDEFFDRPTAPLHAWKLPDGTTVLAGRDLKAGGTWLGVSASGRVAMLTNVRSPDTGQAGRSRGDLASLWLGGTLADTRELAEAIDPGDFAGFNLVAGDVRSRDWCHLSNRDPVDPHRPGSLGLWHQRLGPGQYGLSNASLNTDWPKTRRLQSALNRAISAAAPTGPGWQQGLHEALGDAQPVPAAELPDTGVPQEWESGLASPFVRLTERGYGTRSSLILGAWQERQRYSLVLDEWRHDADGRPTPGPRWDHDVHRREALELPC
ncbi:MAG TPA: NRDE family protein [Hydrogenophaga sp.]|uniref:NRDE family protein n=1 Tax=Hydrogenophaga sp. TaxID=1904254 RepID=UPI002CDB2888|nr:NRDE family protein [Hydrogenophaga sp.]HMN92919.1 NRDE family protein [Hydrogenophaga sp.]HMP09778.1 NRDE family protein [Hydrogenophaga sp.]